MSEWVRVEDGIPPSPNPVLACFDCGQVEQASCYEKRWTLDRTDGCGGEIEIFPTHWMRLPKAPVAQGAAMSETVIPERWIVTAKFSHPDYANQVEAELGDVQYVTQVERFDPSERDKMRDLLEWKRSEHIDKGCADNTLGGSGSLATDNRCEWCKEADAALLKIEPGVRG